MKAFHTSRFEADGFAPAQHYMSAFLDRLKQFWQFCMRVVPNNEPTVWEQTDSRGHSVAWHVHDPASGKTTCFGSELEVRLWLERRYYQ